MKRSLLLGLSCSLTIYLTRCETPSHETRSWSPHARDFLTLAEGELHVDFAEELALLHSKTQWDHPHYLSSQHTMEYLVDFIEDLDTTEFFAYHQTRDAFQFKNQHPNDTTVCPDMLEVEYIEKSQTFKLSIDHSVWDSTGCVNTFTVYWIKIHPEEVTILAMNEPT